jgi:hypothetical protein
MNRLKALYRGGEFLALAPRFMLRAVERKWLSKIPQAGVRRRA